MLGRCSLETHVGSSVAWLSEACVDVGEREREEEMDSPLGPPPDVQTSFCSWPPERQLIGFINALADGADAVLPI